MKKLTNPTPALMGAYIKEFESDNRYKYADIAITNLFKAFPGNKHIEDILLKISVINDLYSTNILGTYRLAQHIQKQNVDGKLRIGDPEVVNQISTGHGIKTKKYNKEINFYSFATKYCSWHNEPEFPIYDSFVDKVLMSYKRQDQFSKFTQKDLKNFKRFRDIIIDFRNYYNLKNYSLKEIDRFLWVYGKRMFPTIYK
jgi:hypothetical protein